jgi:hypothetical protein
MLEEEEGLEIATVIGLSVLLRRGMLRRTGVWYL